MRKTAVLTLSTIVWFVALMAAYVGMLEDGVDTPAWKVGVMVCVAYGGLALTLILAAHLDKKEVEREVV
jgi:hypothetical protein